MERRGFLTAGTWCLDRNITVERWPSEDLAAVALETRLAGGGSACNFAVDMRRLDPAIPVETQGLVGADAEGDFLVGVAAEHGIEASGIHRTDADRTQVTDAYYSLASRRRTHILFYGVAPHLSPDHFDFSRTQARFLHLGLPGLHEKMDGPWGSDENGWVTVLKAARAAGLETNMEFVAKEREATRRLALPCLPHLTALVVNDYEIGAMAGIDTVADDATDAAACEAAARVVMGLGAMELVVVHFPLGAILVARDGEVIRLPSVAVPEPERRGANGAGDAFAAGFFYGRHQGWPLPECLRMAHAAAAACLRASETYAAVESASACLDLAERWGWRETTGMGTVSRRSP
jgi:sugar/nucleoside kinase (ribokinase family)